MSKIITESDPSSGTGIPRWVKLFGIVLLALVALFVILHLTGNSFGFSDHLAAIEDGLRQIWP